MQKRCGVILMNMCNRAALEQLSDKEIVDYWNTLENRLGELEVIGAREDCDVSEEVKVCVSTKKLCSSILRKRGVRYRTYYIIHRWGMFEVLVKKHYISKKGQVAIVHVKDYDPEV